MERKSGDLIGQFTTKILMTKRDIMFYNKAKVSANSITIIFALLTLITLSWNVLFIVVCFVCYHHLVRVKLKRAAQTV
jgi:ABC-type multidrug transport system fused ATPase/permease subunit